MSPWHLIQSVRSNSLKAGALLQQKLRINAFWRVNGIFVQGISELPHSISREIASLNGRLTNKLFLKNLSSGRRKRVTF